MNLTDNDWGLIHDAIGWEVMLIHGDEPNPRAIRLLEIQQSIARQLNYDRRNTASPDD